MHIKTTQHSCVSVCHTQKPNHLKPLKEVNNATEQIECGESERKQQFKDHANGLKKSIHSVYTAEGERN